MINIADVADILIALTIDVADYSEMLMVCFASNIREIYYSLV